MTVKFKNYQGTGNDFIMIDNRAYGLNKNQTDVIERLCDRRFGIGADGLIYLQDQPGYDFKMVYFNSDGRESTMCGNGGRCLVQFAHDIGVVGNKCSFEAIDGPHDAEILPDGTVALRMKDVPDITQAGSDIVMNTGSPHYVRFVNQVKSVNIVEEGRSVRYSDRFAAEGINVNFVEKKSDREIFVRTYERGVEDETLSCGTGVVAACLAFAFKSGQLLNHVKVETLGGNLEVRFEAVGRGYRNVYLVGPALQVFDGEVNM